MRIEVKSAAVSERKGVSDNGKPWHMREQQAYAYTCDRDGKPDEYPAKITVRLNEGDTPYAPGMYEISDRSYYVGQYGRFTIGNLVLQPVAKVAARAA